MKKLIYLDNAATTKNRTGSSGGNASLFYRVNYGNPSSVYEFAGKSKQAVDAARKTIADSLAQSRKRSILPQAVPSPINWAFKSYR